MNTLDILEKLGMITSQKPKATPSDWNDAVEALGKNPGLKAQALYKKLNNRYNLTKSQSVEPGFEELTRKETNMTDTTTAPVTPEPTVETPKTETPSETV